MADFKKFPIIAETGHQYATDVIVIVDAIGNAPVLLVEVMQDFLRVVRDPIVAGGIAVAHHGYTRGTLDIDVIGVGSTKGEIEEFVRIGYKHETVRISNGVIDLLTKGNKGVDFIHLDDDAFLKSLAQRVVPGVILNQPVKVISFEDLIILKTIASKQRSGGKDRLDLENLLPRPYDEAYVAKWLQHFGVPPFVP